MIVVSQARHRLSVLLAAMTILALGFGFTVVATPAPAAAADFTVENWRVVEIPLTAASSYADPLGSVQVSATFVGPGGVTITRPAFWDGGFSWKVRFAPTVIGAWSMTTSATNTGDTGLHGVTRTISAVAYAGSLSIYQHGFLKPSTDGHYLQHADGTPFFYLGDTHWILPHERFSTSNAPGVASQFKYVVDKRVSQGFTVYQSEPIWAPHGGAHTDASEEAQADLTNGFTSEDLAGFANLDRKFAYIADAGLVHANAMIDWVDNPADFPDTFTTTYMADLARYWNARFGSYPVIWTVAQEIDNDFYGAYAGSAMAPWSSAITALDTADSYDHPLMPHQENTGATNAANSRFSSEAWHDGWTAQPQEEDNWNLSVYQGYWSTSKPGIVYESPYDAFWTDSRHALSALYKSYLLGMRGYGYGISGLWNDIYSAPGQPLDAGTSYELSDSSSPKYKWWYDAANAPTGDQLEYGANFFGSLDWWKLTPRFGDSTWSTFGSGNAFLASDGSAEYVALFADGTMNTGSVKQLTSGSYYSASWFDPRTGATTLIDANVEPISGAWVVPPKPSADDWVLHLVRGSSMGSAASKPVVSETSDALTATRKVTLSSPTSGATVYYTTNGTTPTTSSPVASGNISISDAATATLRAIAVASGYTQSAVTVVTYAQRLTDVAQGASYSSSTTWDGTQVASKAFDHITSTNWQACNGCWSGAYLQADFPQARTFDTVIITEYGNRTSQYTIQYWNGAWITAYAGTGSFGPQGQGAVLRFTEVTGTKVRILYAAGSSNAPIVYDMGVYNDPDLTIGATFTSSSSWDANQSAPKAFDGNLVTNWQACNGCWNGTWLQADFGSDRSFNQLNLSEYGNRTTGYRIEYWTGSAWATAYTGTGGFGQAGASKTVSFGRVTGSKVRIYYTSGTSSAPIVYELSVFDNPDLTTGEVVDASSSWDASQVSAKAIDDDPATNWQACNGCWNGQWLQVDFGTPTAFDRVQISEYASRTTGYRIEYWTGSNWATAYSGTGGFGPASAPTTLTFGQVTGSKVRIYYTSGTSSAPIVYEFAVFDD